MQDREERIAKATTDYENKKLTAMEFLSRITYEGNGIMKDVLRSNNYNDLPVDSDALELNEPEPLVSPPISPSTISSDCHAPIIRECCVCIANEPNIIYSPCGHYNTCESCHDILHSEYLIKFNKFRDGELDNEPIKKCPQCAQEYAGFIKVNKIFM